MTKRIEISAGDPILDSLNFKPHYNKVERHFERFNPKPGEPERLEVSTPWGDTLAAKAGDYLVGTLDNPDNTWPVDAEIFENSYDVVDDGVCVKTAKTELVPLVDLTDGDPNCLVTVYTLEGPETVRAGDFYLARGIKDEIWPYPKETSPEAQEG